MLSCLIVVIVVFFIVDVVFVVVVVFGVDVIFRATLKRDLRLLLMDIEFGWVVVVGWGANPFSCPTQLS